MDFKPLLLHRRDKEHLSGRREPGFRQLGKNLLLIEPVHCLLDAAVQDQVQRFPRFLQCFLERWPFFSLKRRQHESNGMASVGQRTDPDADARKSLGPELLNDRPDAVMTASATRLPDPYLSQRDIKVVVDEDNLLRFDPKDIEDIAHSQAALVHVGHGLDKKDDLPVPLGFRHSHLPSSLFQLSPMFHSQLANKRTTDVVTSANIALSWIPQTNNRPQGSLLFFFFRSLFLDYLWFGWLGDDLFLNRLDLHLFDTRHADENDNRPGITDSFNTGWELDVPDL